MNKSLFIIACAALVLTSCGNKKKEDIVSQKYVHKYGYAMAPSDWNSKSHPGQVLTTFRNGKTITESFEDSLLHGEKTITFEHSQTVQMRELYKKGLLVKRTAYNVRGIPEKETNFQSPTHLLTTTWYHTGSPKSKEEYVDGRLINGQYFSLQNEIDSSIINGQGEKTIRNVSGDILSKEVYVAYEIGYVETYHQNNTPFVITSYKDGKINGERKEFALSGEPISVEYYAHGLKDGICSYYQNGNKYQETSYVEGRKHGIEKFYIDGVTLCEESDYKNGLKHGPSIVFCDGSASTSWYFSNERVSKSVFDQYEARDYMITSSQ